MRVWGRPPARAAVWIAALAIAAAPAAMRAQQAGAGPDSPLAARIDAALQRLGPHAVAGVRVVSLSRGDVLYEHGADLSMNPASTLKLFTSVAALEKLGPDYRFATRVLRDGKINGSVLNGDLFLEGGGDPLLQVSDLETLAETVKASGIRRVQGRLRVDVHRYDLERLGSGWAWDDEPYYYSAQVTALALGRNVVTLQVRPGKPGAGATVTVPSVLPKDWIDVENHVTTVPAGSPARLNFTRRRHANRVIVSGSIAADSKPQEIRPTVEFPELMAGLIFQQLLEARGITFAQKPPRRPVTYGTAPANAEAVAEHPSPPLSEILTWQNKWSDNLIAEMLLKEVGHAVRHRGSSDAGLTVEVPLLTQAGVNMGGVEIFDGSGLSRLDLVTPRAETDLLAYADQQAWKETLYNSLPIAGVEKDGTLQGRMRNTPAQRNVHAKTGSYLHVCTIAGYVMTAGGERLAFSIMVGGYPGELFSGPDSPAAVQDEILVMLAGLPKRG